MKSLTRLCGVLQTMSNPSRMRVLEILHRRGETCVCELEAALRLSQSNLSFHLNLLKKDGLVTSEKIGKWVFYSLNEKALKACFGQLSAIFDREQAEKDRSPDSVYIRCQRDELSRAEILEHTGAAAPD